MARPIQIREHHTLAELEELYRKELNGRKKTRIQAVLLAKKKWQTPAIREVVGFSRDWLFQLFKRYNDQGLAGLEDGRKDNGRERILNDDQMVELYELVASGDHPDGGPWTSKKVAAWMTEATGHPCDEKLAWVYLTQHLGFSLQRPAKAHIDADKEAQQAFKKGGFETR